MDLDYTVEGDLVYGSENGTPVIGFSYNEGHPRVYLPRQSASVAEAAVDSLEELAQQCLEKEVSGWVLTANRVSEKVSYEGVRDELVKQGILVQPVSEIRDKVSNSDGGSSSSCPLSPPSDDLNRPAEEVDITDF